MPQAVPNHDFFDSNQCDHAAFFQDFLDYGYTDLFFLTEDTEEQVSNALEGVGEILP